MIVLLESIDMTLILYAGIVNTLVLQILWDTISYDVVSDMHITTINTSLACEG